MDIVRILGSVPTAPGEARRALGDLDGVLAPDLLGDVRLVLTELVTNAMVHPHLAPDTPIAVTLRLSPTVLRIEVEDRGPGVAEPVPSPRETGGRGLTIVDRLAERWGIERRPRSVVWAEFTPRLAG
jgi:anti-sigma regulatory factor (Ser/Thr protein kinase)